MTTVLYTLIGIFLLFALASLGWYLFESRWDRRLFPRTSTRIARNIRVAEAAALLESEPRLAVLDVRSEREFAGPRLPGAVHLPISDPDLAAKLEARDKSQPHLVYCAGGYRSRKVCALMVKQGYREIYNLHRGIHSWRLKGMTVVK